MSPQTQQQTVANANTENATFTRTLRVTYPANKIFLRSASEDLPLPKSDAVFWQGDFNINDDGSLANAHWCNSITRNPIRAIIADNDINIKFNIATIAQDNTLHEPIDLPSIIGIQLPLKEQGNNATTFLKISKRSVPIENKTHHFLAIDLTITASDKEQCIQCINNDASAPTLTFENFNFSATNTTFSDARTTNEEEKIKSLLTLFNSNEQDNQDYTALPIHLTPEQWMSLCFDIGTCSMTATIYQQKNFGDPAQPMPLTQATEGHQLIEQDIQQCPSIFVKVVDDETNNFTFETITTHTNLTDAGSNNLLKNIKNYLRLGLNNTVQTGPFKDLSVTAVVEEAYKAMLTLTTTSREHALTDLEAYRQGKNNSQQSICCVDQIIFATPNMISDTPLASFFTGLAQSLTKEFTLPYLAMPSGKIRQVSLINEAEAALINDLTNNKAKYKELLSNDDDKVNTVVMDVGAGTTDITLARVKVDSGYYNVEVIGQSSSDLAGNFFDTLIAEALCATFLNDIEHEGVFLTEMLEVINKNIADVKSLSIFLYAYLSTIHSATFADITEKSENTTPATKHDAIKLTFKDNKMNKEVLKGIITKIDQQCSAKNDDIIKLSINDDCTLSISGTENKLKIEILKLDEALEEPVKKPYYDINEYIDEEKIYEAKYVNINLHINLYKEKKDFNPLTPSKSFHTLTSSTSQKEENNAFAAGLKIIAQKLKENKEVDYSYIKSILKLPEGDSIENLFLKSLIERKYTYGGIKETVISIPLGKATTGGESKTLAQWVEYVSVEQIEALTDSLDNFKVDRLILTGRGGLWVPLIDQLKNHYQKGDCQLAGLLADHDNNVKGNEDKQNRTNAAKYAVINGLAQSRYWQINKGTNAGMHVINRTITDCALHYYLYMPEENIEPLIYLNDDEPPKITAQTTQKSVEVFVSNMKFDVKAGKPHKFFKTADRFAQQAIRLRTVSTIVQANSTLTLTFNTKTQRVENTSGEDVFTAFRGINVPMVAKLAHWPNHLLN